MSLHFHPLTVAAVEPDTDDAVVVRFDVPAALRDTFAFEAGQYLTLRAIVNGEDLRRSYSICAGADEGVLRVGVRRVQGGVFSGWVHEHLKAGDTIEVFPPQGRFVLPPAVQQGRHVVGIAGGSGITPILSIAKTVLAREPQSRFTLLYANRRVASTMFKDELEDLKNQHMGRFVLHPVFSQEAVESPLHSGRLDAGKLALYASTVLPVKGIDQAFVCGPHEFNDGAESALRALGLKPERLHIERFGTPEMARGEAPPHHTDVDDAPEARVTIVRDGLTRTIEVMSSEHTLLDAANHAGLDLPYSCKSGVCSTCRCKVLEGRVRMDRNFALEKHEIEAGFVLSCQAHALTPEVTLSFDER